MCLGSAETRRWSFLCHLVGSIRDTLSVFKDETPQTDRPDRFATRVYRKPNMHRFALKRVGPAR